MTRVVPDCDPGHDDAIALLLALATAELELLGVTTVSGNQTLEKTTANAIRVLDHVGVQLPRAGVSVAREGDSEAKFGRVRAVPSPPVVAAAFAKLGRRERSTGARIDCQTEPCGLLADPEPVCGWASSSSLSCAHCRRLPPRNGLRSVVRSAATHIANSLRRKGT
jgi:hypothetical protein